jgi:hypothetical protein
MSPDVLAGPAVARRRHASPGFAAAAPVSFDPVP